MLPKKHIIFGIIFAIILFFLFPQIKWQGFLLVASSSVLIDIDHYLYFAYTKRDFNIKHAYDWFKGKLNELLLTTREERNKFQVIFFFFHGIEVLLLLFVLIFISRYFLYVFVGFGFHLLLDSIDQPVLWDRVDKVSLIYDYFKFRRINS